VGGRRGLGVCMCMCMCACVCVCACVCACATAFGWVCTRKTHAHARMHTSLPPTHLTLIQHLNSRHKTTTEILFYLRIRQLEPPLPPSFLLTQQPPDGGMVAALVVRGLGLKY